MHSKLNNWNNGWFGIELAMSREEIAELIEMLRVLQEDSEQHFHISRDYAGDGGIGDIEISVSLSEQTDNLRIGGKALGPGEEIDI